MSLLSKASDPLGGLNVHITEEESSYLLAGGMNAAAKIIGERIATEWLKLHEQELMEMLSTEEVATCVYDAVVKTVSQTAVNMFMATLAEKAKMHVKKNDPYKDY